MAPEAESQLADLRAQIDAVDQRLLECAAERMKLVEQATQIKAMSNHALFDRSREQKVFSRASELSLDLGLDPEIGKTLLATLVEASHQAQEAHAYAKGRDSLQTDKHMLIVGGRGQMGQLFANAFASRGHRVCVLEQDDAPEGWESMVRSADVVMVAVPMNSQLEVVRRLGGWIREDALLFDINSLKQDVCVALKQHCRGQAVGTHPMFGPTVASLRRQKVVFCQVCPGPLVGWLEDELGRLGCEVIHADAQTHDKMMAFVQVLVHFRTIVMGEALRRTGVPIQDNLRFTSPIYRLELAVVGRLFAQDPHLYAEIEMSNPYGEEVRASFLEAARDVHDMISRGDRDQFVDLFAAISEYFNDFSDQAMALSDYLIGALVREP